MFRKLLFMCGFLYLFISYHTFAQASHGGLPESFNYPNNKEYNSNIIKVNFNNDSVNQFLNTRCTQGCRLHVGSFINADYSSSQNIGSWYETPNGSYIYTVTFYLKDAKGIGISFSDINIPSDSKLFVYNASKSFVAGSFINQNIPENKHFTIEPVEGNYITIEFDNLHSKEINYKIEGFSYFFDFNYIYKDKRTGFGMSGDCEVNIHCPEGNSVSNVANAVIRILLLDNGGWYLCTGSLINNTALDYKPYILTAWHCGDNATFQDLNKWIFYFLYESDNCDNPEVEPEHKTLVGCSKIAAAEYYSSQYDVGSDFYLALLNDSTVPVEYHPFYAGWDISDNQEATAKCIHHPSGDIKKVSFTDNITSNCFQFEDYSVKTHWKVIWAETETNHGVTEGGSSGSPLVNDKEQIIGTLSGGESSCKNLSGPDYYGKMAFSWNKNGTIPTRRLDCWLDPINTGATSLPGLAGDISVRYLYVHLNGSSSNLSSSPIINVGSTLNFSALILGYADSCNWQFEGGNPNSITMLPNDNVNVTYNKYGTYNVILTLYKNIDTTDKQTNNNSEYYTKTVSYKNFVSVVPILFPNPFDNTITLIAGNNITDYNINDFKLFDLTGNIVAVPDQISIKNNEVVISFPSSISNGIYILNTKINNTVNTYHVIKR